MSTTGTFGGYMKSALTETHYLHTREAYRDYRSRLGPGGFVATSIIKYVTDHRLDGPGSQWQSLA